jgi:anti-sigma regulatory factor (Ser/Thr protein kinase)
MKFRWLLIFLCSYAINWAQSGGFHHEIITKQDGLELDNIRAMSLDNDGFLWLGGRNLDIRTIVLSDKKLAIQRFNGRTFQNITLPEFNGRIIEVGQFYKRQDGKFYIHARSNQHLIFLFDPYTMEFTKPDFVSEELTVFSHVFGYDDKEYLLSQKGRLITVNILHEDLSLEAVFSFTNTGNKFLLDPSTTFIGFEDYCIIGDDNFPITTIAWDGTILNRESGASLASDMVDIQKKLWMNGHFQLKDTYYTFMDEDPQLYQISNEPSTINPMSNWRLPNQNNMVVTDETLGHLIVSQEEGDLVFRTFDENKGFQTLYRNDLFEVHPALSLYSHNTKKDLWVGTSDGELHYFKFPSDKIKTFIPNTSIRSIAALTDSTYIVATESIGWFQLNLSSGTMSHLSLTENGASLSPYSSRNIFVEGDTIWSNDNGNVIKVSSRSMEAEAFKHYPIICMVEASDSTFIYGTRGYHLMEFNKKTKVHRSLAKTDSLEIFDIELQNDLLVGATDKGVLTYNLATKETEFYGASEGLKDPFILMTDYHKDYGFLLGTRSGSILSFDAKTKSFTTRYEDALKAGIATVLFEGDTWWINTFNGIVAFNPKDDSAIRFSEKDGLSHNEANRYSALDTGDGFLVGTIKGLNYFKPNELKPEANNSELVLLQLGRYDVNQAKFTSELSRSILQNKKEIILPAEHKELLLEFGLTHNVENREHHFKYRLNDNDWVDIKEKQSIRFSNLSPGDYVLEIEALDFSGNKIGDSLLFKINSRNFFYRTWWFYLLVTLGLVSLTLYFLNQALAKRRLQEKFSEALIFSQEAERTRIAKELHDSVGQQLTLIKRKAQMEHLDEITCLTNSALEEVRSISRGLYPAVLKQLGLTECLKQLINDVDEGTTIYFTSELDLIDMNFTEQESLNFYRFMQESIANILKHAEATSVGITIKKLPQKITVKIEDNGIGFDPTQALRTQSLGLKTIVERIRILKGTISITSRPGQGTIIQTEIPVN